MSYYYILFGCTIVGTVVSHAFNNALIETTNELIKRQSLKCNNHCPYGFVPDVEGELTCACYDPCAVTMCPPGYDCEASMPNNCSWGLCRPITNCTVTLIKVKKVRDDFFETWWHMPVPNQRDEPWDIVEKDDSVCSQPLPPRAQQCKYKQRRWFYNLMSGKCERFDGCITGGNNFIRKRHCKARCKGYVIPTEQLNAIESDDVACSTPLSHKDMFSCETKRWYFNEKTGLCEKFTGCKGTGNNFSRKVICKAKCRNMIVKHRRSKGIESHSRSRSPR